MVTLTLDTRKSNKYPDIFLLKKLRKMILRREMRMFFFLGFLAIGSQTAAAQNEFSGWTAAKPQNLPAAKIEKNENALPSFSTRTVADVTKNLSLREETPETSAENYKTEIKNNKYDFRRAPAPGKHAFDLKNKPDHSSENLPFRTPSGEFDFKQTANDEPPDAPVKGEGFNWRGAFTQSFVFLGVQHGYAVLGQSKTRRSLKGKFWKDYVDSVKSLGGWDDGGRFFTNYVAHPMQGSLNGFIYVQNSPQARREQFSMSGRYWKTRMKAMLWTTAWSTQFEIGPISQASIGNVGEGGKQTWEDIVTTPTLGTAMLITEDAIDRYIIKAIERRTDNYYIMIFSRMLLNPTRIFANLLRLKLPWHRDRPREY